MRSDRCSRKQQPPGKRYVRGLPLFLSSLGGLLACMLLTAICVWLLLSGTISVLAPFPGVALLLALVLGAFSVAEVPMMVFLMRRLLIERPGNLAVVLGLNALYVSFAAVYGAPVLLLTGSLGWGLALCSLGIVRFVSSQLFVHPADTPPEQESPPPDQTE